MIHIHWNTHSFEWYSQNESQYLFILLIWLLIHIMHIFFGWHEPPSIGSLTSSRHGTARTLWTAGRIIEARSDLGKLSESFGTICRIFYGCNGLTMVYNPNYKSGLTLLIPRTGVITHLLSGMSHQKYLGHLASHGSGPTWSFARASYSWESVWCAS